MGYDCVCRVVYINVRVLDVKLFKVVAGALERLIAMPDHKRRRTMAGPDR